nr:hypothetical protein BaRGS_006195 [Batillaria attramentaria]
MFDWRNAGVSWDVSFNVVFASKLFEYLLIVTKDVKWVLTATEDTVVMSQGVVVIWLPVGDVLKFAVHRIVACEAAGDVLGEEELKDAGLPGEDVVGLPEYADDGVFIEGFEVSVGGHKF